jgi:hypothetical protein
MQGGTGAAFSGAYSYPEAGLLIKALPNKPAESSRMAYDAEFVSAEIRKKYKIKG